MTKDVATKSPIPETLRIVAPKPAPTIGVAVAPDQRIEQVCRGVIRLRGRPLLVLYYPGPYGQMHQENDVQDCYQVLRDARIVPERPLKECDVLVHTLGGDPTAAYALAQSIRNFARQVHFLVPFYAYSAGTLLCFSGDEIRLGHDAGLSPIDITAVREKGGTRGEEVELTSIDYYMKFATESHVAIQRALADLAENCTTTAGSDLLVRLVEQVGALRVGQYYRARTLTGHYAQELLGRYMLAGEPNARGRADKIIRSVLFTAPAHEYHLDYHLCSDIGLVVKEMGTQESDAAREVVTTLDGFAQRGVICPDVTNRVKMPFMAFYAQSKSVTRRKR